jgi:hypothetical protein
MQGSLLASLLFGRRSVTLIVRPAMTTAAPKRLSILGFSPLRVAYVLSFLILGLVPAEFFVSSQTLDATRKACGVLLLLVVILCFGSPRGSDCRFLPCVVAIFGLLAHMICAPM